MIDTPVRASSVEPDPVVPRRPLRSRFSMAHVVMVLAALIAFVLVLVVLRDRSQHVFVGVAVVDVEQGSRLTAGSVELTRIPAVAAAALRDLVDADEMQRALDEGAVASRSIQAGTTLRATDLHSGGSDGRLDRVMSFEIDSARAAAGSLVAGDIVDVLAAHGDDGAEVVAQGIEVVAARSGSGGFGSSSLVLSLAVDPPTALRLAAAAAGDDVFVVRSTGAKPFGSVSIHGAGAG